MAERIAICEDDEDLAFVLREALLRNQYEVDIAPTAGALLDRLAAGAYDLILLDVKLPDMDGLEAIPKCREHAPDTPVRRRARPPRRARRTRPRPRRAARSPPRPAGPGP